MAFRKGCWVELCYQQETLTRMHTRLAQSTLKASPWQQLHWQPWTVFTCQSMCSPPTHRITGCLRQNVNIFSEFLSSESCTMCSSQGASHLQAILWLPKHNACRTALSENTFLRNLNVTWAMTKWAPSTKECFFTAYVLGGFQSVSKTVCYVTIMAQVLATACSEM